MHPLITGTARAIGAIIVMVPLGVGISISYTFGRDVFGGGQAVYGVLMASFAAVSAVVAFSALGARPWRVRLASTVVLLLCLLCSIAAGWASLGARQDQVARSEAVGTARATELARLRTELAALPPHRDREAVTAEQALRKATARKRQATDDERALALVNELATIRRAGELRAAIAALELPAAASEPRATAVIAWVAGKVGWGVDTTGHMAMLALVITGDVVSSLGLFCLFGGQPPSRPTPDRTREPAPARKPEPVEAAPATAPAPAAPEPVMAAPEPATAATDVESDPVAAFLSEAIEPAPDVVTPYADIEQAWQSWCRDRGVDGVSVNLGFALRRAGFEAAKLPGPGRRAGRRGLRICYRSSIAA